jgi:hypothetical protein
VVKLVKSEYVAPETEMVVFDLSHTDAEIKPGRKHLGFASDSVRVATRCVGREKRLNRFCVNIGHCPHVGILFAPEVQKISYNSAVSDNGSWCGVSGLERIDPLIAGINNRNHGKILPSQFPPRQANFNLLLIRFSESPLVQRNFGRSLDAPTSGEIVAYMPLAVSRVKTCHFDLLNYNYTAPAKKQEKLAKWLRFGDVLIIREGNIEAQSLYAPLIRHI